MASLNIALDFDGTFTADEALYADSIYRARSHGHQVFCVTCREGTDEDRETIKAAFAEWGLRLTTIFTNRRSKLDYCREHGIRIDQWWENDPETLVRGH